MKINAKLKKEKLHTSNKHSSKLNKHGNNITTIQKQKQESTPSAGIEKEQSINPELGNKKRNNTLTTIHTKTDRKKNMTRIYQTL